MEIYTFGDRNKEKILLIHPMFTSANFFKSFVEKLKDDYFFIIPTLSGHAENSTYVSTEQEENALNEFFTNNQIDRLKLVVGFSLGGNIAFNYFCKNTEKIDKVVVDSAPLFCFPKLVKRHFYKKYKNCLAKVRENADKAEYELNKCFHGMGESQKAVAPLVSNDSLNGLIESCYNNKLPTLFEATQRKIVFVYGTKDIARLCLSRIRKYKHSKFLILRGYNHCEFFMTKQDEYINQLVK